MKENLEYLLDKEPEMKIRKKLDWLFHKCANDTNVQMTQMSKRHKCANDLKENLEYLLDKEPEMKIRKKLERKTGISMG